MNMKWSVCVVSAIAAAGSVQAAQRGPAPELLECGVHEGLEVICGAQAPEDLELAPDGARLIVSQFGGPGGLALFDPEARSFQVMTLRSDPSEAWGDPACPGPMTGALSAHGISLGTGPGGAEALYVVNHGGRETIEMFELAGTGGAWELVWRGCAVAAEDYNDVAILPGGGFVATRPQALSTGGRGGFGGGGQPSGDVVRWTPGSGETVLAGTEVGFPNGVLADPDGRTIYFSAWTGREVHKYDLESGTELEVIGLDFMPDNLTWTDSGRILAAGIQGLGGAGGFSVAEIDPDSMESRTVVDGPPDAISGVSVALEVGDAIYVGSFQGDRLVRIDR